MKHPALSEVELDELDNFLVSEKAPAQCLNLEALDGLFCCMAVGPRPLKPSEYEPLIWGGTPVFAPGVDEARIRDLIERHRLSVEEQLSSDAEDIEEYVAIVWTPEPEPAPEDTESTLGEDWAIGFGLGMQVLSNEWEKALESSAEFQSLIVPVMLLELGEHPEDPDLVVNYEGRLELLDVLPEIALGIRSHFRG